MNSFQINKMVDYELIDSGDGEKLERFGEIILIRPENLAKWKKSLNQIVWKEKAHGKFIEHSTTKGSWVIFKSIPEKWIMKYQYDDSHTINLWLKLTSFKHIGVFPEQYLNWDFIFDFIINSKIEEFKFLNLFAYTGGASLAANAAGAKVTHVDAIKQVVSWGRENMTLSKQEGIRWLVEDAPTYAKREVTRGNKYNGIILDPPAFGFGPNGEKWKFEKDLENILLSVKQLINPKNSFVILNAYTLGLTTKALELMFKNTFDLPGFISSGELTLKDKFDKELPFSIYVRWSCK